jgi:hypothetical protein
VHATVELADGSLAVVGAASPRKHSLARPLQYTLDMTNTLPKLCYCQSTRHGRAVVRALEAAGHAARYDAASGYVYATGGDAALAITTAVRTGSPVK